MMSHHKRTQADNDIDDALVEISMEESSTQVSSAEESSRYSMTTHQSSLSWQSLDKSFNIVDNQHGTLYMGRGGKIQTAPRGRQPVEQVFGYEVKVYKQADDQPYEGCGFKDEHIAGRCTQWNGYHVVMEHTTIRACRRHAMRLATTQLDAAKSNWY